jgi:hypothetical protein
MKILLAVLVLFRAYRQTDWGILTGSPNASERAYKLNSLVQSRLEPTLR